MRLLGFEYESVSGFILYFIIASIVSYPYTILSIFYTYIIPYAVVNG